MRTRFVPIGLLLTCSLTLAGCGGRDFNSFLESGDRYFKARQYLEAIVEYRNAVKKNPRSAIARTKLADAYVEVNDPADAAEEYKKAAELLPNDAEAQLKSLRLLFIGHWFEEVRDGTAKILTKDPKNIPAHVLHASALAKLKQFDAALAELQQTIALDPLNSDTYVNLGAIQLLADKPDQAEQAFKMGVQVNPSSVSAQLALAAYDWAHGRVEEAERAFKRTVELDRTNPAANRALAVFYLGSNRAAEAENHLKAVVEATPTTPERLALADYYVSMKRMDQAMKLLDIVEKTKDGYAEARSRRAAIAYEESRREEAHAIIDETLRHDRNNARALLTKARFLFSEGLNDEALGRAKAAVVADQRFAAAHSLLGSIYEVERDVASAIREFNEVLRLDPQSISAQVELAKLHLANGAPGIASDFADQVSKAQPGDVATRLLLIRALIGEGDMKRAEEEARSIVADQPKIAEVHSLAGTVYLLKNERDAARQAFEKALALKPDAIDALDGLIGLELGARRPAAARELVDRTLAQQQDNRLLYVLAGKTYATVGANDKAEAVLRKAIALDPSNPEPFAILGQLYISQQRLDRALVEFEEAARKDPKPLAAQTMMGLIFEMMNKPDEAQRRYEKALEIEPHAVVAANNLAWLHASRGGNLDVALQLAQIAKGEAPFEPVVNDTLGWVYFKKGLASLAIPLFEISSEKDPKNPSYRFHLGLAYAKVGDRSRAQQYLGEALRLDPEFDGANEARRVLASTSPETP